jgi:hypothetical protein
MERLLLRVNPHLPPPDAVLIEAQHMCGRWCALRRLRLRLTSEQLAGMVGISAEQLRLLEAGLADADSLPNVARQRMSTFLKSGQEDSAWIAEVLAIALGRAGVLSPTVIAPIVDELDAIDTRARRDRELTMELVEQPRPESPGNAPPVSPLEQAPAMFEVLRVLVDGESYTYAIWEIVRRRLGRIGIAEIGELLERMRESRLIEQSVARLDPALDDEPIQFYRIAVAGRQAFNAERTRKALLEAESQPDSLVDPGADAATPFTNT